MAGTYQNKSPLVSLIAAMNVLYTHPSSKVLLIPSMYQKYVEKYLFQSLTVYKHSDIEIDGDREKIEFKDEVCIRN